ncbi:AAA family ATPase [Tumidithrix elongata RA019]|uniref:AAA family ATPase n=1 Tax=Tumidithrix elongata BACA0141 TaxID=2716417 RepID=A0AAW9PQ25_9CYAN|nr:AAA family ATPase [Tumidithrix elongata RA019]
MRIEELHIQNFRGFKDLTLKFPSNLAVLIGINGSGKSSILDCLSILLLQVIRPLYTNSTEIDPVFFSESDISNSCKNTLNTISISFLGEYSRELKKLVYCFSYPVGSSEEASLDKERSDFQATQDFSSFILTKIEKDRAHNIPLVVYYTTDRKVSYSPLKREVDNRNILHRLPQLLAYKDAINKKISFEDFFIWFKQKEDLELEHKADNFGYQDKELDAVRESIISILPDFTDLKVKRSRMEIVLKKQGQELVLNQLSDGEKNLLAMIGDLARRLAIANPSLENPLQGSGIVLIDEIELHLHPQWQRRIIPALTQTFPNLQFIVTTHSPQVLSNVRKENVFILEDFKLVENTPYTYGRDSNSILYELMGVEERIPEIKQELDACFDLIDRDEIEEAKEKLQELSKKLGQNDPEIIRANTLIDFFHRIG